MRTRAGAGALAASALLLGGCGSSSSTSGLATAVPHTIKLTSSAFAAGGTIPRAYTCDGSDQPLPLRWSGAPARARTLTLVMRDPDAAGGVFIHWTVSHIPPTVTHIGGGASLPPDAIAGRNSFGVAGYRGPCPPRGDKPHHYVITLTAYGGSGASGANGAPFATGQLIGTYSR